MISESGDNAIAILIHKSASNQAIAHMHRTKVALADVL
jgi:hypothetical protein